MIMYLIAAACALLDIWLYRELLRERHDHQTTKRALRWWRDERQGQHGHAPGLLPVGDPVVQVAAAEYHAQANGRSRISNDRLAAAVRRLEALGPQPKPPASGGAA